MIPTVVTFWTDDWYRDRAISLEASCRSLHLPFIGIERADTGAWVTNAAMKPTFILGMLLALTTPVLWIDADATVIASPALLIDTDVEFAVRLEPGGGRIRRQSGRTDRIEKPPGSPDGWVNSGTVYFSQAPAARKLAVAWVRQQKETPRWYDQWTLQYAWVRVQPTTLWLPPGYCSISKHRDDSPVIKHEFASQLRKVSRT